jgi:hypothetical protein
VDPAADDRFAPDRLAGWTNRGGIEIVTTGRSGALVVVAGLAASALAAQPAAVVQVLPAHPAVLEPVEFLVTGTSNLCWPALLLLDAPQVAGEVVTLAAHTPPGPLPPGCSPEWPVQFEMSGLPAGSYSAEFRLDGDLRGASAFEISPPGGVLELQGSVFLVTLRFHDPLTGVERLASAVTLSADSGFFWFFEPGNVEVTVKILDGRAINGRYWLFAASMTDVGFTLAVHRHFIVCGATPCGVTSYTVPSGENRNFIDTNLDADLASQ